MGFVKFDDLADDHPKVIAAIDAAGEAAGWLWFRSVLYAGRTMTDGFIPQAKVIELTRGKPPKRLVQTLLACRLWEAAEGGYLVHDFLDHNVSAAERKDAKRKTAERVARHRARNADVTPLQAPSRNADVRPLEVEGEEEVDVTYERTDVRRGNEGPVPIGDALRASGFGATA